MQVSRTTAHLYRAFHPACIHAPSARQTLRSESNPPHALTSLMLWFVGWNPKVWIVRDWQIRPLARSIGTRKALSICEKACYVIASDTR